MALIEKLGSFYLGKEYDLAGQKLLEQLVNYDSRDLTTHALCVGMTGSGKTGLCIDLLEEAAIDGVPAILIDPKGDITNLLLTFPDLRPEDFRPWINEDDAQRKGMTADDYAARTAQQWRDGLAAWDEGPERIRLLKDAAEFSIYTPGSAAGLPISILSGFAAPKLDWDIEAETLRDKIQGTVSGLLGMVGIAADPVRSREHILLSNIMENAWRAGQDLDIAKLIMAVQNPPFRKLGVFDLDSFYPQKERFALALALNNIVASPSFEAWLTGDPLDISSLLHTPTGKPRHSIFYIAHLNDAERMFFVTILLEQIISWMRAQPGTTSLRAIVYMDEVFGFFPPVAEPPSKRPMLTLLKQGRAFGVGVVLTTQNPVDVDYKGLTNAGTWFIGKLQAERDKSRLLEGLQSAMAEAGTSTDASELEKIISSLDSRLFLLHDVNLARPVVFSTRWAMSYLRGPLTRAQIKQLMAGRKPAVPEQAAAVPAAGPSAIVQPAGEVAASAGRVSGAAAPSAAGDAPGLATQPPVLPPGVKQVYLPASRGAAQAARDLDTRATIDPSVGRLVYSPGLLAFANVHFVDRKSGLDVAQDLALLLPLDAPPGSGGTTVTDWQDAVAVDVDPRRLADRPDAGALFRGDLPAGFSDARAYTRQQADLVDYLYRTQVYALAHNPTLKLYAEAGESERDFSVRCQQAAREGRDAAADKLRAKYAVQLQRIQDKLTAEQRDLTDAQRNYRGRQAEEVLSGVATVAGWLGLGGRRRGLSGISSVASKNRLAGSAKANIAESQADVARLQAQLEDLKSRLESDTADLTRTWDQAGQDVAPLRVTPRKSDVQVQMLALAWAPNWEFTYLDARGLPRTDAVPAYDLAAPAAAARS